MASSTTSKQTASSVSWILVADRARGFLFRCDGNKYDEMKLVKSLDHPEGAAKPQEVNSDRQGRFMGDDGAHVSGDPETDLRHKTAEDFAMILTDLLEKGRQQNEYQQIIVFAPPLLLGELRKKQSRLVADLITREFDIEIANLPQHQMQQHIIKSLSGS